MSDARCVGRTTVFGDLDALRWSRAVSVDLFRFAPTRAVVFNIRLREWNAEQGRRLSYNREADGWDDANGFSAMLAAGEGPCVADLHCVPPPAREHGAVLLDPVCREGRRAAISFRLLRIP